MSTEFEPVAASEQPAGSHATDSAAYAEGYRVGRTADEIEGTEGDTDPNDPDRAEDESQRLALEQIQGNDSISITATEPETEREKLDERGGFLTHRDLRIAEGQHPTLRGVALDGTVGDPVADTTKSPAPATVDDGEHRGI